MRLNQYRQAVAAGRIPIGHMVWEFGTRGIARLLDSAHPDFVIFDMEHSGFCVDRIFDLMSWTSGCSFAPFVRVPQPQYHFLARIMDAGALGVMIANVESTAQAKDIVSSVKYAPMGNRGVGLGSAHTNYVVPDMAQYFADSNESCVVICQIESPRGVANAAEIAAVPGVDILWVGHADLSTAMGIPGQFDHPDFIAALRQVVAAANSQGKRLGIQPGTQHQLDQWMDIGFNVISWSVDTALYRQALTEGLDRVRAKAH